MKTNLLKKIFLSFLCIGVGMASVLPSIVWWAMATNVPSYEKNFRDELLDKGAIYDGKKDFEIDRTKSLKENIEWLFSPNNGESIIWKYIKEIMIGITILFIAWAGIDFLTHTNDPAKLKSSRMSMLYILVWGFLIYSAVWIVGSLFDLSGNSGPADVLTYTLTQKLFFTILSFLKAGAFFLAIIMAVVYGYQMITAMDKDELAIKARKGIMNVLLALVGIKVIDFIYFIAQEQTFGTKMQTLLFNAAKMLWWAMGGIMVAVLIYGWFRYISAQGDETKAKDAQKMITKIFYAVLIVFMFLLITRQIIEAFTK